MPEANKIKKDEMMVDIDTSGPETEVSLPEEVVKETAPVEQTCRQNPGMCNPNARGAQLEAFRGLDPDGDSRVHGSRAPASFSP